MQTSRQPSSDAAAGTAAGRPRGATARKAGALLILTAVASLVAVGARVSADADQPTLAESLAAISESSGLYGIGGAARLVSGITLIIGAWVLSKTWPTRERPGKPIVPALLAVSGIFTAVSGVCAIALALYASVPADPGRHRCLNRDNGLSEMAHRQNRLRGGGAGSGDRGAAPVESRRSFEVRIACIGHHRYSHAVHLVRCRNHRAPRQRGCLFCLAGGRWGSAPSRPGRAATSRDARLIPVGMTLVRGLRVRRPTLGLRRPRHYHENRRFTGL